LEASIRSHREQAQKNTKGFKDRLGQLNGEKSALNTSIADLNNKLKTITAERDLLKSAPTSTNEASKEMVVQLETLRREKAALEKMLAEEKTKQQNANAAPTQNASSIVYLHLVFLKFYSIHHI
jgi:nucleoprotein TPR